MNIRLNNYNSELHDKILSDVHHFIRFNSDCSEDRDLKACFSNRPVDLVLNYQTILNLRLVSEHLVMVNETIKNHPKMNEDCLDTCKKLIGKLRNPCNGSIAELERVLKFETTANILAFLNGDDLYLQDKVNKSFEEKVSSVHSDSKPQFRDPTGDS